MSASLLKREIEAEFARNDKSSAKKKTAKKTPKLRQLLPTERRGIRKKLRQLKRQQAAPKKTHNFRFALPTPSVESEQSRREELLAGNLRVLQRLSGQRVASGATKVIVGHIEKEKRLTSAGKQKKKKEEEKTVFTDEDFERLSKAFFIKSKVPEKVDEDKW